jgi:hypothetical protein
MVNPCHKNIYIQALYIQHLQYCAFGMPFIDDAADVGKTDQMGGGLGKGKVYDMDKG